MQCGGIEKPEKKETEVFYTFLSEASKQQPTQRKDPSLISTRTVSQCWVQDAVRVASPPRLPPCCSKKVSAQLRADQFMPRPCLLSAWFPQLAAGGGPEVSAPGAQLATLGREDR